MTAALTGPLRPKLDFCVLDGAILWILLLGFRGDDPHYDADDCTTDEWLEQMTHGS